MKASYRWLSALVPGLSASPREVAERFTRAGIAVDGIDEYGAGTETLVLAAVRKIEPHPKRDKLRLVTVDRGDGVEQRVVCGAPNVPDPGFMVALAPVGATLPAIGVTLTPRDIGGVVSEGMLCSEMELGLSISAKEDDGILTFAPGFAKPGTKLREALPSVHDFIFEIDLTPNRPDALGHIGLARELAALFEIPFAPPGPEAPKRVAAESGDVTKLVSVDNRDTERCPVYGACAVVDVALGPSPLWLKYRLESLGVRSISNVVDVTNLVLLEHGHPMHAFDLDLVRGASIIVRRAAAGEPMRTLDGIDRALTGDDLVICDAEGPVALAGVMGGENSEIRATTKRVLLECAYFAPRGVRRTSRRHAIHTESSHRFERGVDPNGVPDVLAHAASLLTSLAGGKAVSGSILAGVSGPIAPSKTLTLRASRMEALLGVPVSLADASAILARLGFSPSASSEGQIAVSVPSFRPDVAGEADLIEEVIRVRGIDSLPSVLPAIRPQKPRSSGALEARVRGTAIAIGLSEALTFAFTAPRDIAALGLPPAPVTIVNPLGEERSVMRTTLLPGLCDALRRARRHGVHDVRLFALGARFLAPGAHSPDPGLPDQIPSFAAILAGHRDAVLEKPAPIDVYDAKGVALEIVELVTGKRATIARQTADERAPYLHPRAAGDVIVEGRVVGAIGVLHPDVVDALDLGGDAAVVELDLRALASFGAPAPKFKAIPSLPANTRDVALVVHDDVEAGSVGDAIREAGGDLCESVELFDLFRGGSVPADHRSLAFHVVYRDPKATTDPDRARTLTDAEVDTRHDAVVKAVNARFGAVLRA